MQPCFIEKASLLSPSRLSNHHNFFKLRYSRYFLGFVKDLFMSFDYSNRESDKMKMDPFYVGRILPG